MKIVLERQNSFFSSEITSKVAEVSQGKGRQVGKCGFLTEGSQFIPAEN